MILQLITADFERRIIFPFSPLFPFFILCNGTKESCDRGKEVWTNHSGRGGKEPFNICEETKKSSWAYLEKERTVRFRLQVHRHRSLGGRGGLVTPIILLEGDQRINVLPNY